ncbi:hypothetical protein [Rhodomicrobium lacus]|jgi:hypothetical protein|uniref:hypothetical protein n=1 Tax=Rhodomicrobium TaxID=1068 RepID=UPI001FE07C64|nr:hypothetical protein [Rhodomicrobium lacus]WKW52592.1 hypothetical protein QMO75_01225 [Rhodomicrobium lacus]
MTAADLESGKTEKDTKTVSSLTAQGCHTHARIRAREAQEFRLMFIATFPLFLAAGLVKRAVSPRRGAARRKSVFAEARAAANTCIPFAFMR